jgi:hypothetical protein
MSSPCGVLRPATQLHNPPMFLPSNVSLHLGGLILLSEETTRPFLN